MLGDAATEVGNFMYANALVDFQLTRHKCAYKRKHILCKQTKDFNV